jgi:hypothetical protein
MRAPGVAGTHLKGGYAKIIYGLCKIERGETLFRDKHLFNLFEIYITDFA